MSRLLFGLFLSGAAVCAAIDFEQCESWAESGECESNPTYMKQECAKSCENAGKFKTQMQKECEGYALAGECSRNPAFMLSTCRKECDKWEASKGGAVRIDRSARCVEWSLMGKCEHHPGHDMATECNTSCTIAQRCAQSSFSGWSIGTCDKALRCEVEDKRSNCGSLAAQGECSSNAVWMAQNCLVTCSAVDVDGVLSAQRAEFRTILSPLIDLPGDTTRRQERCWLPGWSGQNHYKQMLPTQCAAPRKLPWQRRRVPRARLRASTEDQVTCPVDVASQTPRVGRSTRHVTLPPHTLHTVRVQQVLASPRVRLLHEFLTEEEATEILRYAEPRFTRSPVRSVATDRRTSMTATIGGGNWAVQKVRARISAFSGYEDHHLEPLQVVRYFPGQKYDPHHDLFDICDFPQKPRRHLTFLIYLNSMPGDAGGHTSFPRLNVRDPPRWPGHGAGMIHALALTLVPSPPPSLSPPPSFSPSPSPLTPHPSPLTSTPHPSPPRSTHPHQVRVQPTARTALVFNDVLDNGLDDERTEHGGSAPSSGVKYAINCWIRARPEEGFARKFSDLLGM